MNKRTNSSPKTVIVVLLGILLVQITLANCHHHHHHHHHHNHANITKRQINNTYGEVVQTIYGKVRGIRNYLPGLEKTVDTYWGIPFARPPNGTRRFRLPVLPDKWNDIYNAVNKPKACPLILDNVFGNFNGSDMWNDYNMSEDCLYLNVFVPRPITTDSNSYSAKKNYSVMVWIYGGGFYSGSSTLSMYDGKYLAAAGDVIVVSMNYRVGAFGFFSMNSTYTPSNVGMYDQLAALEWVQSNIAAFGGDVGNVTIFGESAGSVSVSLHLLSPLSRNKFQRAILQSGAANMPWAVVSLNEARRRSEELAQILGCNRTTIDRAITCMLRVPWQQIVDKQWQTRGILQFPFVPAVDGVFLPDYPKRMMASGDFKKCPILAGSNKNEASFFLIYELYDYVNLTYAHMNREGFLNGLNKVFYFYPQYPHLMPEDGQKAVAHRYSPPWVEHNDTYKNLLRIDWAVSDAQFLCPMNHFIDYYAKFTENVYSYYFTQRIKDHMWPEWMGVLHADEIFFIINHVIEWRNKHYTQVEVEFSKRLISFWSNFAKTGNPNDNLTHNKDYPYWSAYTTTNKNYLDLNTIYHNQMAFRNKTFKGLRVDECSFWLDYIPDLIRCDYPDLTCEGNEESGETMKSVNDNGSTSAFISLGTISLFVASALKIIWL